MSIETVTYTQGDQELSVTDLLLAVNRGDMSAWDEIVRRYSRLVFATVQSFRLPHADANDAVQSTWLRLAEHYQRVENPERLGGWLTTTARRECLRILREAKRLTTAGVVSDNLVEPSAGPEQQAVDADTVKELRSLLAELTPRQQAVLSALFTDSPCPYTEIARANGIPSGSIGPTRKRALAQLRRRLHEHELV